MLDAFGTLLDRSIIKVNSEPKYPLLIQMYESELDSTKKMFDAQNAMLKVTLWENLKPIIWPQPCFMLVRGIAF